MEGLRHRLILFGCGGHSRSVADIVLANESEASLVFVDPNARENESIYGFPVVRELAVGDEPVFLAIGDNARRREKLEELGMVNLVSVVSARAHIGHRARVGAGCFVGNFCHIGPEAVIGRNTIINNAAVVEHEVVVGEHCHVGPNATISGRCRIGDEVFVGVGATIKDYVTVCPRVTIGAGATVVKDISEAGIYIGCPARKLK